MRTVLWWGRSDPEYSRNRIVRQLLTELGWGIRDFRPALSPLGDLEARIRGVAKTHLVWVPCFRQRDLAAGLRWARRHGIPLLADPLISAYDKQVDERGKLAPDSDRARRLLRWESRLLTQADLVLADTPEHARYFHSRLGIAEDRLRVLPVGAEEPLFRPAPQVNKDDRPVEVLFFGSYIPLQDPRVIAAAARLYSGPPVVWHMVGDGPLRSECVAAAAGLTNVRFEDWVDYKSLPDRIHRADIVLGIFGATPKAGRVIPNKVYQALACGRPVITRRSPAYDAALLADSESALCWVPAADPEALAAAVARLAADRVGLGRLATAAARTYAEHFSRAQQARDLAAALAQLGFT